MPSNFYRSDGWVKLVSGQAVPGAQVYILNQPANVTPPITPPRTIPVPFVPNPQAQIYSDAGFTPIVQPIITDGFGHYDFYALPGLYTVAIFFGGKLQQFYVDQTIGNVGTAGISSVLLETNGSPNFNQALLNLQQGTNIILTPDNFGNVTITSMGAGTVLKTNGVTNGSQTLLNLVNGSNIAITQDGAGNVTLAASGGAGANVADLPNTSTAGSQGTGLNVDAVTYTFQVSASGILQTPARWKITVNVATGPISWQNWVVARTLPGSLTVIDYTPITWGGTQNPTMSTGLNTSDAVTLQIDTAHDYWFMGYSVHQSDLTCSMFSVGGRFGNNFQSGVITGATGKTAPYFNDYTNGAVGSPNTIVLPNTAFGLWMSPWQAA